MAVEAGRLGGAELVVVEIGIVDHRGDLVERRIGQLVAGQDGLERASALVVAEFDTAHVDGVPPRAAAASASAAKANSAPGSTKRRRSQAHAVRSMCGCGRVIQSMLVSWGPSPRKWRLDPRDGGCDRDLGVYPAGCAEVSRRRSSRSARSSPLSWRSAVRGSIPRGGPGGNGLPARSSEPTAPLPHSGRLPRPGTGRPAPDSAAHPSSAPPRRTRSPPAH